MNTPINIQINGASREVSAGTTVADLLVELELDSRPVAVEVNLELVPKARHAAHQLRDHDCLEVVTLVGGG